MEIQSALLTAQQAPTEIQRPLLSTQKAILAAPGLPILTTGKDAVRLLAADGQPRPEVADLAIWWVPVQVSDVPAPSHGHDPAPLRTLVLEHVRAFYAAAGKGGGML